MKQTFLILIAVFLLLACSNEDDSSKQSVPETESDFYTVTLNLQGISGAGYNTLLRINTFHQSSANIYGVYESQGDIQWNDDTIEYTFTVDAETANEIPLTRISCFVETTLRQEYSYAINYFTFTAILKDSEGNIISELSTNEDLVDGWLSFSSILNFDI